ncbi:MAG: DUF4177 domain-containing protein [Streptosporangiales bacterium]
MQYKIITEKDRSFRGKFDPEAIEGGLNEHASEGWRVVHALHVANLMKSLSAEIMVALERTWPHAVSTRQQCLCTVHVGDHCTPLACGAEERLAAIAAAARNTTKPANDQDQASLRLSSNAPESEPTPAPAVLPMRPQKTLW